jgi:hypothetical protein
MSKTRTGRRPGDARCARRSLVELTAAASCAVDDGLFVMPASLVAASPDDPPRSERAAKTSDRTVVASQATAPIPVTVLETLKAEVSRSDELIASDSTVAMLVKIAKHNQTRAFENIKVSLDAALDYAKAFVETPPGSEAAAKHHSCVSLNNFFSILEGAAADFRAESFELMKANVFTTLEYAGEVLRTTTAAEFVELSSAQARKQCELILKQTRALESLAQTITKSSAD